MPGRAWHGIVRRPQGHRGQGSFAVTRETSTGMPISSQASLSVELPKRALRTFRSLLRIASLANYEVSWRRRRWNWHAGAWLVFRPVCSRAAHSMMKQGAAASIATVGLRRVAALVIVVRWPALCVTVGVTGSTGLTSWAATVSVEALHRPTECCACSLASAGV
jgi:hypothetical protein